MTAPNGLAVLRPDVQPVYVQSHAAIGFGIADKIPHWYAPSDPAVLEHRTFFDPRGTRRWG